MFVFITGATGWVGSITVQELLQAGHDVYGLVRSREKANALAAIGASAVVGTLDDLDLLASVAERADAVIHTAFNHDFSNFIENAAQDRRAINALTRGLKGGGRRLVVTSGVAVVSPGMLVTEDMLQEDLSHPRQSELEARVAEQLDLRVSVVRLAPSVHGEGDQGFISTLIDLARRTGVSAYLGDGSNRWSAVHRLDTGRIYRKILEAPKPQFAYHGVAEEGVIFRDIAEVIGRRLSLPVESRPPEHFGWLARFASGDFPASSALTRESLLWSPEQVGLLADLQSSAYFSD